MDGLKNASDHMADGLEPLATHVLPLLARNASRSDTFSLNEFIEAVPGVRWGGGGCWAVPPTHTCTPAHAPLLSLHPPIHRSTTIAVAPSRRTLTRLLGTARYKPLWTALHKHTEALVATGMLDEDAEDDEAEDDAAEVGGGKGADGMPSSGVDMSEGIEALHAVANLTLAWIGDKERVAPEPLLSTACILHDLLFDLQVGAAVGRCCGGEVPCFPACNQLTYSLTYALTHSYPCMLLITGYGGCGSPGDHLQDLRGMVVGRTVRTLPTHQQTNSPTD